jgi:hypothetical protein
VQWHPGVGLGDLFEELEEFLVAVAGMQASVTLPVATSSAANSVVVPWRT